MVFVMNGSAVFIEILTLEKRISKIIPWQTSHNDLTHHFQQGLDLVTRVISTYSKCLTDMVLIASHWLNMVHRNVTYRDTTIDFLKGQKIFISLQC